MHDYDENLEVVRLRISGASETLQGYNFSGSRPWKDLIRRSIAWSASEADGS